MQTILSGCCKNVELCAIQAVFSTLTSESGALAFSNVSLLGGGCKQVSQPEGHRFQVPSPLP